MGTITYQAKAPEVSLEAQNERGIFIITLLSSYCIPGMVLGSSYCIPGVVLGTRNSFSVSIQVDFSKVLVHFARPFL